LAILSIVCLGISYPTASHFTFKLPPKNNIGRGRTSLVLFPGAENPSYATGSSSSSSSSSSGGGGGGGGDRSADKVKSKTHLVTVRNCFNF